MSDDSPTIIAVDHFKLELSDKYLNETAIKLKSFLEALPEASGRRLFIEGEADIIQRVMKDPLREKETQPFKFALLIATKRGWEIIPMDRKLHDKPELGIYQSLTSNRLSKREAERMNDYVQYNLRERNWATLLKRREAKGNDLIVINPNHVEGLLLETNWDNGGGHLAVLSKEEPARDVKTRS